MPDAVLSVNLHAIPLNLDEWAKISAGLTAEQEGTLLRALRCAWNAGHRNAPAASLPNDDAELALILGTKNKRLLACVRRFFAPSASDASLLVWPWLATVYANALERYQRRKLAGVESGETRRRLSQKRRGGGASAGRSREQCSNNVPVMLEQPKPNPVGVGLSDQPPTGEAVPAPALGGRAAPPEGPARFAEQVTPEQVHAWLESHQDVAGALEREADAWIEDLNPDWRTVPRRFGVQVREDWLREQIARRVLAVGGPHD